MFYATLRFILCFFLRMMMVCPYIHLCALICKQHLVSLFPHLLLSVQLLSFDVAADGAQGRRRRGAPLSARAFWAPPCSTASPRRMCHMGFCQDSTSAAEAGPGGMLGACMRTQRASLPCQSPRYGTAVLRKCV